MSSLADRLRAGKAVIENPDHWLQGTFSDLAGNSCAAGAVFVAEGKGIGREMIGDQVHAGDEALDALEHSAAYLYPNATSADGETHEYVLPYLCSVNNHIGHDAVMAVYDHAIAAASQ